MARLEREPWPGFDLSGPGDIHEKLQRQAKLVAEIRKDHFVVKFPVADGYALYAVVSEKPLTLQHIPYCDGYRASAAEIRGFNASDLKRQKDVEAREVAARKRDDDFWASVPPGSILHYDHGFGREWVRCEAVRVDGQTKLVPVALLGEWRSFDLPQRHPDGSLNEGYWAGQIREREAWTPNLSCVWESPQYVRRGNVDPTGLEPIDLAVPEQSDFEKKQATLWSKIGDVQSALVTSSRDPQSILDHIREIVSG